MPYEGLLSTVCEVFGCPPEEAERQDWQQVHQILEYRLARRAVEVFNSGAKGIDTMAEHPELMNILLAMHRAQGGAASREAVYQDMSNRGQNDGDGRGAG